MFFSAVGFASSWKKCVDQRVLLTGFQLNWHECIADKYEYTQLYTDTELKSACRLLR